MSEPAEYGSVDRFQAGAIGEPGDRTFYVYIDSVNGPRWFVCEKGQVAALAEQSLEVLGRIDLAMDEAIVELTVNAMGDIPQPQSPQDVAFRIGSMAMRFGDGERMTLILADVDDEARASFDVSREQLRAMSLLALEAVNSGRPICPKCHLPEDLDGHICPSNNGHRTI